MLTLMGIDGHGRRVRWPGSVSVENLRVGVLKHAAVFKRICHWTIYNGLDRCMADMAGMDIVIIVGMMVIFSCDLQCFSLVSNRLY